MNAQLTATLHFSLTWCYQTCTYIQHLAKYFSFSFPYSLLLIVILHFILSYLILFCFIFLYILFVIYQPYIYIYIYFFKSTFPNEKNFNRKSFVNFTLFILIKKIVLFSIFTPHPPSHSFSSVWWTSSAARAFLPFSPRRLSSRRCCGSSLRSQ